VVLIPELVLVYVFTDAHVAAINIKIQIFKKADDNQKNIFSPK
jgi:hypothetical protein